MPSLTSPVSSHRQTRVPPTARVKKHPFVKPLVRSWSPTPPDVITLISHSPDYEDISVVASKSFAYPLVLCAPGHLSERLSLGPRTATRSDKGCHQPTRLVSLVYECSQQHRHDRAGTSPLARLSLAFSAIWLTCHLINNSRHDITRAIGEMRH